MNMTPELRAARRDIGRLTRSELSEKYNKAHNSWKNCKSAAKKKGKACWDKRFEDFGDFLYHMGPPPAEGYTLDRTDNSNPVHSPENCRWASKKKQANNRSTTINLLYQGQSLPLTTIADLTGTKPETMRDRYNKGWCDEDVIYGRTYSATADHPNPTPWPNDDKAQMWEDAYLNEAPSDESKLDYYLRRLKEGKKSLTEELKMYGAPRQTPYTYAETGKVLKSGRRLKPAFRSRRDNLEQKNAELEQYRKEYDEMFVLKDRYNIRLKGACEFKAELERARADDDD